MTPGNHHTGELSAHEMPRNELFELFAAASAGTLTDAQAAKLEQAMLSSPATRRLWFVYQDMELGLADWAASQSHAVLSNRDKGQEFSVAQTQFPNPKMAKFSPMRQKVWRLGAIAAALTVLLGVLFGRQFWGQQGDAAAVATITTAHHVHWQNASPVLGKSIHASVLEIDTGVVGITMTSGARLVFEGPGKLELATSNSVRLFSGRLFAHVPPPAHGFRVEGMGFSVIDHGTEFGCHVAQAGHVELHTFTGEVEIQPWNQAARRVFRNEAVALKNQNMESVSARREAFLGLTELEMLTQDTHARLTFASRLLASHPDKIVHFLADDVLHTKHAKATENSDSQRVTRHGCATVAGRHPTRSAIGFAGKKDFLHLDVQAKSTAVTMLAWLQLPTAPISDPTHQQQLLGTVGPFEAHEIAWGIIGARLAPFAGVLRPVANLPGRGWQGSAGAPIQPDPVAWRFLVTVIDCDARKVSHYVDGELTSSQGMRLPDSLSLGPFWMGGVPSNPYGRATDRAFHGNLDEFAIVNGVLTHEDIRRLYQLGRAP